MNSTTANCKSLDCPRGLGCRDYECEFRHLDPQEQQQQQQMSSTSSNPNCIVTASRDMGRTASTWVFNAVRLLHRQSTRATCDSYWMRELSKDKIQERLDFAENNHRTSVLIKTHEFSHYYPTPKFQQELLPLISHVIVSHRQGMDSDPEWDQHATCVVHYEDIVMDNPDRDPQKGSLKVLRELANHTGLSSLTDKDLQEVDYQLMTLPIPGDQASKFWSFHARRGGRTCPSKPQQQPQQQQKQSTTKRLVFVTRHGARLDNGPDRDSHWLSKETRHKRRSDAPLSALGHVEAKEMAQEVQKRLAQNKIDCKDLVIVSSPYVRCLETAQAMAELCSVETTIQVEPGISEVGSTASCMGSDDELRTSPYSFSHLLNTTYQAVMSRQELPRRELGDGAAAKRAERVARTIAKEKFPNAPAILFVGHGASCLGLVSAFGAPQEYVGYCSLTQFEAKDNTASWKLAGEIGSVDHLSDPQVSLNSAW